MPLFFPSLAAAPKNRSLLSIMTQLNECADGLHIDLCETSFTPYSGVPLISIPSIISSTKKRLWVHLMTKTPASLIPHLSTMPPDTICTFHPEAVKDITDTITLIKKNQWQASIAISSPTILTSIQPWLSIIDHLTIMTVQPGKSGQRFNAAMIPVIEQIITLKKNSTFNGKIGIDGGINTKSGLLLNQYQSIDHYAIGSALFKKNTEPCYQLNSIKKILKKTG